MGLKARLLADLSSHKQTATSDDVGLPEQTAARDHAGRFKRDCCALIEETAAQ